MIEAFRKITRYAALCLLAAVLFSARLSAQGTEESTFEWGLGFLSLRLNHYRGSDQFKNYILPFPYFSYQSSRIEAEPSFVRGTLYRSDYIILKISLMAGLSVESKDNRARQGMPDLGYMFEAGPMIIVTLWRSGDRLHSLSFESPVRYVFATDFTYLKPVGIFTVPYLNFVSLPQKYTLGIKSEFSAALMYGSRGYHDFFYTVEPKYARPIRPEYHAGAGYSGLQLAWILSRRAGTVHLLPFARYDYLRHTVFEHSPLVRTRHYFAFGLGSFYMF